MGDLGRESSGGKHRYQLVMPEKVFEVVQEAAADRGVTVANFIRKCIVLGLLAESSWERGGKLIRKEEGKKEVELIMI